MKTFALVAQLNSVHFLSLWFLYQLDIKNIYLHCDLPEEVCLNQPPRYIVSGSENLMCRLKKALYELK